MFLQAVIQRNPSLLSLAARAHQAGLIPPDTYVLDLDTLEANCRHLAVEAERTGLQVYFMAKQLGRNPAAVERVLAAGLRRAVCVDMPGALALSALGARISHLGHLVQIPAAAIGQALQMEPEAITVYSFEKAARIAEAAARQGRNVNLILRVVGPADYFFPGQVGGIPEADLVTTARRMEALAGARVAGVTSFPCLTYDRGRRRTEALPNAHTVARAASALADALGRKMEWVIMPGMNSSGTFSLLRSLGATHVEPGHALTGTTPLHVGGQEPEVPAMVYVSEVSHYDEQLAYCFTSGMYRRAQARWALVGHDPAALMAWRRIRVRVPSPGNISYYSSLEMSQSGDSQSKDSPSRDEVATRDGVPDGAAPQQPADSGPFNVGATVLMAPRTQLFNVRSHLAVITKTGGGEVQLTLYRPGDVPDTPVKVTAAVVREQRG